jgi:hypothetical protein
VHKRCEWKHYGERLGGSPATVGQVRLCEEKCEEANIDDDNDQQNQENWPKKSQKPSQRVASPRPEKSK